MTLVVPAVLIVLGAFVLPVLVARRIGGLKVVVPLAAAATALGGWVVWSASGESTEWDTVTFRGDRTLEIAYTGSECEDHRSVSVDESDDRVTISIKTWSFASSCSDVGFTRRFTVTLDRPIGDRKVVHGQG